MNFLLAKFSTPPPVNSDSRIEFILERCRGASITHEDLWDYKIQCRRERMQRLESKGKPIEHPDIIIEAIERARTECGPTKRISIPLARGGDLAGGISESGMLLHCEAHLKGDPAIKCLVATLVDLKFDEIEVVDFYEVFFASTRQALNNLLNRSVYFRSDQWPYRSRFQ